MAKRRVEEVGLEDDPLWFKDAIIYELHVRAFYDKNGDGIGDFAGLVDKLDYLQDLGVTALWLLPFYPSPLRDDGYDIADYRGIHNAYGDLRDFKTLLREAHRRGLRVITELVINHTSDQHPWFQRARKAKPNSRWRRFYVWSDTPELYRDARIIFQDFEHSNWTWDPEGKAYFWHRFYHHQPDLNFESPDVRRGLFNVLDFWMKLGVDGMRLDAIPYLYEEDGTNCENLPQTHTFLKSLRAHVDRKFKNRMFLAEANQWPEDAAAYYGEGDECHMNFHFPLMPRMFMALRMEDSSPIIDILEQTPRIPDNCQWATFLRNHDELTLEMVTDEERDYMYRAFAQDVRARINLGIRRRLAPLLGNDRRSMELMNGLLFSLGGTPVIYYGDEIGMGDNIYLGDRNSVRTPMQWSADRNAGFSRANAQSLYLPVIIDPEYHFEAINVEAQQQNPNSLLWWMKRLIGLRKRYKAFGRGTLSVLHPDNRKVLTYLRRYRNEVVLCVANLSRYAQCVELDLSEFKDQVPVELFSHNAFPPIGELPYFLTLGGHAFYWFSIEPRAPKVDLEALQMRPLPKLSVKRNWMELFRGRPSTTLEAKLVDHLPVCRWFRSKGRVIRSVTLRDVIEISGAGKSAQTVAVITLLDVEYKEGEGETYMLPLAWVSGKRGEHLVEESPRSALVAQLTVDDKTGWLIDACWLPAFGQHVFDAIRRRRRVRGTHAGTLFGSTTKSLREISKGVGKSAEVRLLGTEQSNTSIRIGEPTIFKLFRKVDVGINPDLEVGRFLTEKTTFRNLPPVGGALEYVTSDGKTKTLGILQGFIPNYGDAWSYSQDALGQYFEAAQAHQAGETPDWEPKTYTELARADIPETVLEHVGPYFSLIQLLGQRTAELHEALASRPDVADFEPEESSTLYQRSVYQSVRNLVRSVFRDLRQAVKTLPEQQAEQVQEVLGLEDAIRQRVATITARKLSGVRTRIHGDFHLGQVLYTGNDFIILDFEGEPARPLSERRLKRSPLTDVASMLRSFHYAPYAWLMQQRNEGLLRAEDNERLRPWARAWQLTASAGFLRGYLSELENKRILPEQQEEIDLLLEVLVLEKAVYELGYEANNRPDWLGVPLDGLRYLLG